MNEKLDANGLLLTEAWYWDSNEESRKFAKGQAIRKHAGTVFVVLPYHCLACKLNLLNEYVNLFAGL